MVPIAIPIVFGLVWSKIFFLSSEQRVLHSAKKTVCISSIYISTQAWSSLKLVQAAFQQSNKQIFYQEYRIWDGEPGQSGCDGHQGPDWHPGDQLPRPQPRHQVWRGGRHTDEQCNHRECQDVMCMMIPKVERVEISGFEIIGPNNDITYEEAMEDRLIKNKMFIGRGIVAWSGRYKTQILTRSKMCNWR